jgi:hypothetical protein
MRNYRFYFCDESGRVVRRTEADCVDEADAEMHAQSLLVSAPQSVRAVEIWTPKKLVQRVTR